MAFHVPEDCRVKVPGYPPGAGNNGAFRVRLRDGQTLQVIASDGGGWDHVSVSLRERIPTWREMCAIKDMFWDDTDCVIQYHPPKSRYVNHHPNVLHLWRPQDERLPIPPIEFV